MSALETGLGRDAARPLWPPWAPLLTPALCHCQGAQLLALDVARDAEPLAELCASMGLVLQVVCREVDRPAWRAGSLAGRAVLLERLDVALSEDRPALALAVIDAAGGRLVSGLGSLLRALEQSQRLPLVLLQRIHGIGIELESTLALWPRPLTLRRLPAFGGLGLVCEAETDDARMAAVTVAWSLSPEYDYLLRALEQERLAADQRAAEARALPAAAAPNAASRRALEENAQLRQWLDEVTELTEAVFQSWRWRLGDRVVRVLEWLLGRRQVALASDRLQRLLSHYQAAAQQPLAANQGQDRHRELAALAWPERTLARVAPGSAFATELRRLAEAGLAQTLVNALEATDEVIAALPAAPQVLGSAPLVSVVMPTYNRAAVIGTAITSVLQQDDPRWELLVCDDASADNTGAVVEGFGDERIRYLALPKGGAAAARNAGLRAARGEIIAYLDSDNLWHPSFLRATVHALEQQPGHSAVYTDYVDYEVFASGRLKVRAFAPKPFDFERLLDKNFIDLNGYVHRRELFDCFGGFDERLKRRQDYHLILKHCWLRDPLYLPSVLTLYQRNEELAQITKTQKADTSCIRIIDEAVAGYLRDGLPQAEERPVQSVTIISWDLCRNHFSKAFALAEALAPRYRVQLIAFRFFDEPIFPPLADVSPCFETLYLPGGPLPQFFESLARALAAVRGDVIYAVKPRLPSLGLALLANAQRGTPVIMEANDLETVVSAPRASDRHRGLALDQVDPAEEALVSPYAERWSQLLDPLVRELPVVTTHNRALDAHYGHQALYLRNIKDEQVYDPAAYDRAAERKALGFAPADRVILFGGLLRKHKGIYELVQLQQRLGDKRYKLLFVGSRPNPDQERLIKKHGRSLRVLPPQDRTAMARINLAADLVVLWLDPQVAASHYQMPYKLTDALAMGTPVISNPISDLEPLGMQGYLRLVDFGDWEGMLAEVRRLFEDSDGTATLRDAARRLYLRQFSYTAARSAFALAAYRASRAPAGAMAVSTRFERFFDQVYRAHAASPDSVGVSAASGQAGVSGASGGSGASGAGAAR